MIAISSSDIVKKPSFITNPQDITFVNDMKKNITKSVVIPYEIYTKVKEKIEDELYLYENQKALGSESYNEFLSIEDSFVESIAK